MSLYEGNYYVSMRLKLKELDKKFSVATDTQLHIYCSILDNFAGRLQAENDHRIHRNRVSLKVTH